LNFGPLFEDEKRTTKYAFLATQLIEAFKHHLETRFAVQAVNDFVLGLSAALVDRHALRAFDAIQLAVQHAADYCGD
jgi:hypothetical protein